MFVEKLENEDFNYLFKNLVVTHNNKPVNYQICCNNKFIKQNDQDCDIILFLKDYTCHFTYLKHKDINHRFQEKYRQLMCNLFKEENYEQKLKTHLNRLNPTNEITL